MNPWLFQVLDKFICSEITEAETCPGDGSRVFEKVSMNSNYGWPPAFLNGLYLQGDKRQRLSV